ncbi:MAG: dihydrolipoamide acetyltransferase family protein [Bacillaceae bacterium]
MAIEKITMPQLGESVTEGTISKWLVSVGDKVNKYDPLAEVMTDKVNAEIPSSFEGIIKELVAKEDDTLEVGEIICFIETESASSKEETVMVKEEVTVASEVQTDKKVRYSPAVLSLANQHEIDLTMINGTGMNGRVTRKDVLQFIENKPTQKVETKEVEMRTVEVPVQPQKNVKQEQVTIPQINGNDTVIPVTAIRRSIAANMVRSKHEIPHAWMMIEVDVTNLVNYRNKVKKEFKEREGFSLTFFAFFVKAVATALKEFPMINATWAKENIIIRKDVNISIAVANEGELFVPVIKHADEKSIKGIARDIYELANKARTGKLKVDDSSGGTFTLNNTGSFGSVASAGIINYPQAAILQVESIVKRPVIVNDMIAVRSMVNLCLSLDHRVLDGYICGQFLGRVKEILEGMNQETTSLY